QRRLLRRWGGGDALVADDAGAGGVTDYGFVEQYHPDYHEAKLDWDLMRDALHSRKVKEARERYLPRPSGFTTLEKRDNDYAYDSYLTRAKFPPFVAPILRGMAGILSR